MKLHFGSAVILTLAGLASAQQVVVVDNGSSAAASPARETIQATLMLQDTRQTYREASLSDTFFEGQRFRLRITVGQDGYLYVLCDNSQGSAVVLYPNDGSAAGNHVRVSRKVTIPDKSWFQFDAEPGTEQIYLVLSEHPITELERAAQRGGEINSDLVERYARMRSVDSKGIVRSGDVSEVLVRKIELRHESR